jgi:ERCC4-type nuclease
VTPRTRANSMTKRKVYAICLREKRGKVDGVLMIVDDREEAEEIAFELRRSGHDVEVREYRVPDETTPP